MKQRMWFYLAAFLAAMLVMTFLEAVLKGHTAPMRPISPTWLVLAIVIHGMIVHYAVLMYRRAKLTSSKP